MHIAGPKIYQMKRHINSIYTIKDIFQNMCDMIGKNWLFGRENRFFARKKKSKLLTLVDTNLGYLTLEGPGRQTVDARSTLGLPLKIWGYESYNYDGLN